MTTFLKFDSQSSEQMRTFGLPYDWCASLFLGESVFESIPKLLEGISPGQMQFAARQTLATDITYVSFRDGRFGCSDPWQTEARCEAFLCMVPEGKGSLPHDLLPIYYGCKSVSGEVFWLCVYSTYGRVTQVFFPGRSLVIFDIYQSEAEAVIESLQVLLSVDSKKITAALDAGSGRDAKCVGLLDMVNNFAHQAINHLSGLQRLVDLALLDNIGELWVSGTLFFGQVESLFPEIRARVRYFSSRWDIAGELSRERRQIIRVGSTYLSANLRRRILGDIRVAEERCRSNLLVITLRAAGRKCVNLPNVVGKLHETLRSLYDLRIALDGWVLPESAVVAASSVGAAVSNQYVTAIRDEMALAQEIERKLPHGTIVANTIGRSMLESLGPLASGTCYFSHVGTLQHKLGMILRLPGVVHGPTLQVTNPEGGSYMSEDGVPPLFVPADAIRDIPSISSRGQSFADYEIVNLTFIIEHLARLMRISN